MVNRCIVLTLLALGYLGCQPQQCSGDNGGWVAPDSVEVYDGPDTTDLSAPQYPGQHWYERYLEHNCASCPECCVEYPDRKEIEDVHCTPDVCPGSDCPCILDEDGLWWVDETRFGSDDNEPYEESGCGGTEI
jgi:hypothetical protein